MWAWWCCTSTTAGADAPPVPAGGFITPYAGLGSNISDDPGANANVIYSRVLSEDVVDFTTGLRLENGTITANIRLQAKGEQRPGTLSKTEENLEVMFTFQPKNSWPKI